MTVKPDISGPGVCCWDIKVQWWPYLSVGGRRSSRKGAQVVHELAQGFQNYHEILYNTIHTAVFGCVEARSMMFKAMFGARPVLMRRVSSIPPVL